MKKIFDIDFILRFIDDRIDQYVKSIKDHKNLSWEIIQKKDPNFYNNIKDRIFDEVHPY